MKLKHAFFAVALAALASSAQAASVVASASATIIKPITVSQSQALRFGTLTTPTAQSAIVLTPSGVLTTGASTSSGPHSQGSFLISGEPNTAVNVTVDPSFQLNGPTSFTVTTSNDFPSGATTLDTTGASTVNIGGSFTLPVGAPDAAYTGQFNLTANYQ